MSKELTYEEYLSIKTNTIISDISQKYTRQITNNPAGFKINNSKYLISIKLDQIDANLPLPEGLYFMGLELKDDGKINDEIAGDGIFTSTEYLDVAEEKPEDDKINKWRSILSRSGERFSCIGCDQIDFAGPEEACLGEGTCPEFDWWSNWFCVCGSDCYFCVGDSCDCE
ncbi:hypothetical protein [Algoriphagus sp.]|uniref:hypothetical protein n=1 Tax=Algoriphagus sp. TaxID=1872435 RepID=UPI003F6FB518